MTESNTIFTGLLSRLRRRGGVCSPQKRQQAGKAGNQVGSSANARRVHDIRVVGNRFVHLCRENYYPLTSVGLQKFIFLAHGWHMGLHGIENRLVVRILCVHSMIASRSGGWDRWRRPDTLCSVAWGT
jgi:hypothetical protein